MAPIRRYLRVTRYTVLEVRIHLDDPSQLSWLLRGSNAALPRVITAIRPLVLPKLREENERASKGKTAAKKRGVKDTVKQGDSTSLLPTMYVANAGQTTLKCRYS
jgi:hypothetical protein